MTDITSTPYEQQPISPPKPHSMAKERNSIIEADVSITSSFCSPSEHHREQKKNRSNNNDSTPDKPKIENTLQFNFPPPEPLPSHAECLISDPSKITIKFTYRPTPIKKHNLSFYKDSNDLSSVQQHKSFENSCSDNQIKIDEIAIMKDLQNPSSLSALYDIEKRNL